MTLPPKFSPVKTLPPKRCVGLDGVTRIIVYAVTGEAVSVKVVPDEPKPSGQG